MAALVAGCAGVSERERVGPGGGAAGTSARGPWSARMEERRVAMAQAARGTGVGVTRTADDQLKLEVPNEISFDTGSFALKPQLRSVLDPFAASFTGDAAVRIRIVGHTDSTGSAAINGPLSLDRAQSVRDYLVVRGVSARQIEAIGRGDKEPLADNATEAGRARNRRVEVFLREEAPG